MASHETGLRAPDRRWQARTLEHALEQASMFTLDGRASAAAAAATPDASVLQARADVAEVRTPAGRVVRLHLQLDVPPGLVGVLDRLDATVEVERARGNSAIRTDLPVAAERAAAVLDTKVQLARAPQEVPAVLADRDAELVLLGLDWVEARRVRGAALAVAELLGHEDERVRLRAIEVLGKVGSVVQVRALIAAARLTDRAHTGRLYEALASLGGPDAEGFLAFAARNEDDPALGRLAQRALDEAQAGAPRLPPPPRFVSRGHR